MGNTKTVTTTEHFRWDEKRKDWVPTSKEIQTKEIEDQSTLPYTPWFSGPVSPNKPYAQEVRSHTYPSTGPEFGPSKPHQPRLYNAGEPHTEHNYD